MLHHPNIASALCTQQSTKQRLKDRQGLQPGEGNRKATTRVCRLVSCVQVVLGRGRSSTITLESLGAEHITLHGRPAGRHDQRGARFNGQGSLTFK